MGKRLRIKNIIVLFIVGLVLLFTFISPNSGQYPYGCLECHSGFQPFTVELVSPVEIPVGETFEISVIITNNDNNLNNGDDDEDGFPYDIKQLGAELNLYNSTNLALSEGDYFQTGPDLIPGKSFTFFWILKAIDPGLVDVICEVNGTIFYDHETDDPDSFNYTVETMKQIIDVKPLSLHLSTYSIMTYINEERHHEVVLTADEDITDLRFIVSEEIQSYVNLTFPLQNQNSNLTSLIGGEWLLLNLTINSSKEVSGALMISWVNSTEISQNLNLSIRILKKPISGTESLNWFKTSGQISGISLLGLFITSIFLGGNPPRVKRIIQKLGRQRIKLH